MDDDLINGIFGQYKHSANAVSWYSSKINTRNRDEHSIKALLTDVELMEEKVTEIIDFPFTLRNAFHLMDKISSLCHSKRSFH